MQRVHTHLADSVAVPQLGRSLEQMTGVDSRNPPQAIRAVTAIGPMSGERVARLIGAS